MKEKCCKIDLLHMFIQITFNHWTLRERTLKHSTYATYKWFLFEHYDSTRREDEREEIYFRRMADYGKYGFSFAFFAFALHNATPTGGKETRRRFRKLPHVWQKIIASSKNHSYTKFIFRIARLVGRARTKKFRADEKTYIQHWQKAPQAIGSSTIHGFFADASTRVVSHISWN